jgi:WD40 repeat protein
LAGGIKVIAQNSFIRFFALVFIFFSVFAFVEAQSAEFPPEIPIVNIPADAHTGSVTCLVQDESGKIISAGEDGFINIWDLQENAAASRFQLSPYPIISMAQRPGRPHIAIIESDEMGLYRISAWDYIQNKKLFTLRFKDPVSHIAYSAGGSFLIAARNGRTGVVFINPENGTLLQAPQDLTGTITFAATGKSERTMIAYSPLGVLSYWNLETGELMQQAAVPQNMKSPILFNNNLFFVGFDNNGLIVLDALSGKELSRNSLIQNGKLHVVSAESRDLICIQEQDESSRYMLLRMDNSGSLRIMNPKTIPANDSPIICSMLLNDQVVLGMEDGKINLYQQRNNSIKEMQTGNQLMMNEIAASGNALAMLNNSYELAFIPSDFNEISIDTIIRFEDADEYNEINAADIASYSDGLFVLWKSDNAGSLPIIRNENEIIATVENLSKRYALRTVSIFKNLILFLNAAGNISIYNIDTQSIEYQYNATGSLHANIIGEKNIIISRSANTENTPFFMLNTSTGETVPLAYPADIGMQTKLGNNGTIYAAVVNEEEGESITSIINVDTSNPADSRRLVEYQGEDTSFSMAECSGNLATSLGGDGATLFTRNSFNPFERSSGLPEKIVNSEKHFIVLDNSGSIIWHNASTGEIEATLLMYDGKWYLQKENGEKLEGILF